MRTLNRKNEKNDEIADPYISETKNNALRNRLTKLKDVDRPITAKEVSRLAELGDFSENIEYQLAKGKLRRINSQILVLESQIKRAIVIETPSQFERVQIGHTVTVGVNGKQKKYLILGSLEADPTNGIISHFSPLGQVILGRRVGDRVSLNLADRVVEYIVLGIS